MLPLEEHMPTITTGKSRYKTCSKLASQGSKEGKVLYENGKEGKVLITAEDGFILECGFWTVRRQGNRVEHTSSRWHWTFYCGLVVMFAYRGACVARSTGIWKLLLLILCSQSHRNGRGISHFYLGLSSLPLRRPIIYAVGVDSQDVLLVDELQA